jgi:ubiquinol-cytochrome c reductase cytochrome b/c1 subunit
VRRTSKAEAERDTLPFWPYFVIKDLFALVFVLVVFAAIVGFMPNFLGHPDNYIEANPLVTPAHIVPEWYFLPFYAILRAVPDKLGGVLAMFGAIAVLFVVPWLDTSKVRSANYRPLYRQFFWVLVVACILLGYAGSQPAEGVWLIIARVASIYYFAHFLIILPLLGKLERPRPLPSSISEPVLTGGGRMAAAAAAKPMEKA